VSVLARPVGKSDANKARVPSQTNRAPGRPSASKLELTSVAIPAAAFQRE
jgi:hypothetical protein